MIIPKGTVLIAKVKKNRLSDLALLRRELAGVGIVLDLQLWARRPQGGYTPCGTVSATPEVWRRVLPALAQEVSAGEQAARGGTNPAQGSPAASVHSLREVRPAGKSGEPVLRVVR